MRAREPVPILYPTTTRFHFGPAMIGEKPSGGITVSSSRIRNSPSSTRRSSRSRSRSQSCMSIHMPATAFATASGTLSGNSGASGRPVNKPHSMTAR